MNSYQTSKWEWVALEDAVEICDYLRKPVNSKERAQRVANKREDELYPYYGATGQVGYIDSYLSDGEYVLLGEDGAPFLDPFAKKAYLIKGKGWVNNHAHVLKSKLNNKFLCYYLNQVDYNGLVTGTTRYKLTQAAMKRILVPTPDLVEQERIVSKIEELFSRLDASVAELKTAKEKLKVYRQAVLKEAFTGLSNKRPIREMTSIVTSGSRGWAKYYSNSGAKFIRIGNLTRDSIKIDLSEPQYVSPPVNTEGARTKLQPNDVLVSITADLGSIGLVTEVVGETYINQHIALVRFKNSEQSEFMAWYLRSDWGQKDLLKNKRGAGKLGLGLNDIRDAKVPVVSDERAKTIVSEISGRLSVCDSIEQTVDTSLQKAEALRQSILKQAFEGRLN